MRFFERDKCYYGYYYQRRNYRYLYQFLAGFSIVGAFVYLLTCIFLYFGRDYLIDKVDQNIPAASYNNDEFQLDYQKVWMNVPDSKTPIQGWWFDAPSAKQPVIALPDEPTNILTTPTTILYLCGSDSKTHYNSLVTIQALQQLGFSVLKIPYRGYDPNQGGLPNESRLYQDSQAAWDYLITQRQIKPQNIVIYGESLGGAIAIDLAVKQNAGAGIIVQSSFTSIAAQIKQLRPALRLFPLEFILGNPFNSIDKVRSLSIPVLFLHGTEDTTVDYKMSRQLYYAAPEPKELFYIPGAEHLQLYQPEHSYLKAIQEFMTIVKQH